MNNREKLVELLKKDPCTFPMLCSEKCKYISKGRECFAERYADYLVENNVIVLPCKLGDTVWVVNKTMGYIHQAKFRLDDLDQIGRRVFLTKAEAEKFLRGGKKR